MVFASILILLALSGTPDAVHLLHRVTVTLETDGSVTERTRAVIIPLTGRGVQRFSSMSVSFRSGMEELNIEEASVGHWRGGRGNSEASVSTGPHSVLSRTNRLESSLRESIISMPGVEVGDTVKIEIVRTIHSLALSPVYSYSFSPVLDDSVVNAVFNVYNDAGVPLYYSSGSTDHIEYLNLSPAPSHPLAAYDPPVFSIATGSPVRLSADASEALDIPEHAICQQLDEIVQQMDSSPSLLRQWVSDNINYTGADTGVWPGWSPRSPEETLEDGSGVCRDRAVLLTWLLRKAGFEAYPALATTGDEAPQYVDARSFDHMITVYRNPPDNSWLLLDPTPRSIPLEAGFSFGLRGCSYLPLVPGGTELETIPVNGWNDTLRMNLTGSLDLNENLITGVLRAESRGTPLELITTIYNQSGPSMMPEMFRRFFGALSCDSVAFNGSVAYVQGTWSVHRSGELLLLPGLREISLPGTRIAAMLLPCPPDSFIIDAPATEILEVSLSFENSAALLPEPLSFPGYSCSMSLFSDTLSFSETADVTNRNSAIIETLLVRSGTEARTVRIP